MTSVYPFRFSPSIRSNRYFAPYCSDTCVLESSFTLKFMLFTRRVARLSKTSSSSRSLRSSSDSSSVKRLPTGR